MWVTPLGQAAASLRLLLRILLLAISCQSVMAAAKSTKIQPPQLASAQELGLPIFQDTALAQDLPAKDLFFANDHEVWILGTRSLWSWNLKSKKLKRITLVKGTTKDPGFSGLGTDGVSLFATSANHLFQVQLNPTRIFRYRNPFTMPGHSLGLAGTGDQFYWLHTTAIMKLDRYGRALIPRIGNTPLRSTDQVLFDPETLQLFYARGPQLIFVDLATKPDGKVSEERLLFKAQHPVLGLQFSPQELGQDKNASSKRLFLHTARNVLVLNDQGRIEQTIPVEGNRELMRMLIQADVHSYLFSDSLLEVFQIKTRSRQRYHLPLSSPEKVAVMKIQTALVGVIDDGVPRIFSLAKPF